MCRVDDAFAILYRVHSQFLVKQFLQFIVRGGTPESFGL